MLNTEESTTQMTAPERIVYSAPEVKVLTIRSQGIICTSPGFGSGDGGYDYGGNLPI